MANLKYNVIYGDSIGYIEVGTDKITLKTDKTYSIRTGYVSSLTKVSDMALSRVGASLEFFDLFGNKETKTFAMHTADFKALKKALGK